MSNTDIKEVVKEKYGQAALRVKNRGQPLLVAVRILPLTAAAVAVIRSPPTCTILHKRGRFRKRHFLRRSDVATRRLWHSSIPARLCLILAPAAASMCCFLPNGSAQQGKHMAST